MEYPYKTSFSAEIKVLTSEEKDKYLSQASLNRLKGFIPQEYIDNASIDLLPFVGNGAVINRSNKNSDAISSIQALELYKGFLHRPIDLEHRTNLICGHIINVGFSKFGSDEIITPEEASKLDEPYNLVIAGYFYKRFNENLVEDLEESNDPSSTLFQNYSLSWELGFTGYTIVKGSKNIAQATIITDKEESEKLEKLLKINGGKGRDDEGNYVYRLIDKDLFALGFAITENPAADVKGIYVPENIKKESIAKKVENNKDIISHSNTDVVNKEDMKILKSFAEFQTLNDETVKEVSASSLINVVADEIRKISDTWKNKEEARAQEESQAKKDAKDAKEKADKLEKEVEAMKKEKAASESEASFNNRMSALDEEFQLETSDRTVIAKQIKSLDDESFATWLNDFEVLSAAKKKDSKKVEPEEDDEDPEEEAKAKKDKLSKAAEAALTDLKESKSNIQIPNTSHPIETLTEKFKNAFTLETVVASKRR